MENNEIKNRMTEIENELHKFDEEEYRYGRTLDKMRVCKLFSELWSLKKELNAI